MHIWAASWQNQQNDCAPRSARWFCHEAAQYYSIWLHVKACLKRDADCTCWRVFINKQLLIIFHNARLGSKMIQLSCAKVNLGHRDSKYTFVHTALVEKWNLIHGQHMLVNFIVPLIINMHTNKITVADGGLLEPRFESKLFHFQRDF